VIKSLLKTLEREKVEIRDIFFHEQQCFQSTDNNANNRTIYMASFAELQALVVQLSSYMAG